MATRVRLSAGGLVLGPPGRAHGLVQEDQTTCGATCVLAARLLYERDGAAAARLRALEHHGLRHALLAEQQRLQALMNRHARGPLGPLPWPRRLGSTPWAVARALEWAVPPPTGPVAYTVTWGSERGPHWFTTVARLRRHLAAGLPAILLAGGPVRAVRRTRAGAGGTVPPTSVVPAVLAGAERVLPALPRHYVLALPWSLLGAADPGPGSVHVYDPASGTVGVLDLVAPRDPEAPGPRELGHWPRVLAVVEPC